MSRQSPVLILVVLAVIVGAALYVLAPSAPESEPVEELVVGPSGKQPVAVEPARSTEEVTLGRNEVAGFGNGPVTSVLWPLVVDLELEAVADLPTLAGVELGGTLGGGATARLAGRVGLGVAEGAAATITFIAGPNKGRVLHTDADGRFGATDLLPGLSMVSIQGPGLVGAQRELRLRQRHEALLNIGFGRLGNVQGYVMADEEAPIENAIVSIDGHETRTDHEGYFYLGKLASGRTHIQIEKEGFASLREEIAVTAAFTTPIDRLRYRMVPGSTLTIAIEGNVGGPGPAEVWLNPGVSTRASNYPYWKLNPVQVFPNRTVTLRDLPSELIRVQVFRAGAVAEPESRNINLRASQAATHTVQLDSAPKITGVVMEDGEPVVGATVTLEAPDQVQAALRHYRQPVQFLESAFLPMPPSARQVTTTDARGRFVLSAWSDGTPARYIGAESPDGDKVALRLIDAEVDEVSLDLRERSEARGVVRMATNPRFQGLPIEWRVNGEPRESFVLPPGQVLEFAGLREGRWRVRARWHADELFDERGIEVTRDGVELGIELPDDAIVGQDREAWERAGREYPF